MSEDKVHVSFKTVGKDDECVDMHGVFRSPAPKPVLTPMASTLITNPSSDDHDEIKQDARLLRHQVLFLDQQFTEEDWRSHVSFRRYLPEPIVMVKVVAALAYPLAVVTVITAGCAVYEHAIRKSDWVSLQELEASFAYSLCSFALSLLLIFKTNTAYSRFWEARGMWGAVYTDCRLFMLKLQGYAPDADPALRKALLRWTVALPYVMRSHMIDYRPGSDSLEELLVREEVEWLRRELQGISCHQPLRAVNMLVALLAKLQLADVPRMDMMNLLQNFMNRCGACERIRSSPIPMPYTRHTTRFILWYVAFMPIVLWRHLDWAVFFVAPLITILLVGIDNIGIQIENPISILPMSKYCTSVHNNLILISHDWVNDTRQDAFTVMNCVLSQSPPSWQQCKASNAGLPPCGGSLSDVSLSSAPATYRIGRRLSNV